MVKINCKKAGIVIIIPDNIDFKTKTVIRDKERHYMVIKCSIREEDITITYIYAPNIGAPQYMWKILLLSHVSCVRLCDSTDGSQPDSPIPGILQARTLEWVAISFPNA